MSVANNFALILFIFFSSSCAVDTDAIKQVTYRDVRMLLSDKKCTRAEDILDDMDDVDDDPIWYSLKASAQACKGDFAELDLVTAVADLGDASSTNLLSLLAGLSTSVMTEADVDAYSFPQEAINTLLFSNDEDDAPSAAARLDDFGDFDGGNINWQLFWMLTYNLGKWVHHYGDTDTSGTKGAGADANNCLIKYTAAGNPDVYMVSGAVTTICTGAASANIIGHPDLDDYSTDSTARRRVCEGIILFNNWFDVLPNLGGTSQTSSFDNLPTLATLSTTAKTLYEAVPTTYYAEEVFAFTSQETCEDFIEDGGANAVTGIEQYFTFALEVMSDVPPP